MGRRTQEALRAYQTAQHLTATGRIDKATLDRLGVGGPLGTHDRRAGGNPQRRLDATRAIIGACFFYAALLVIEGIGLLWRRREP